MEEKGFSHVFTPDLHSNIHMFFKIKDIEGMYKVQQLKFTFESADDKTFRVVCWCTKSTIKCCQRFVDFDNFLPTTWKLSADFSIEEIGNIL